jgi:hypothetical protein
MEGQLVDVDYENGIVKLVKIEEDGAEYYRVTPLIQTCGGLYRFSNHSHTVPKESVSGFYDTKELNDTGLYKKVNDVYYESIEDELGYDSEYSIESESDTESEVSIYSE